MVSGAVNSRNYCSEFTREVMTFYSHVGPLSESEQIFSCSTFRTVGLALDTAQQARTFHSSFVKDVLPMPHAERAFFRLTDAACSFQQLL